MSQILHIETITEMSGMLRLPRVKHPLVAVVDFTQHDEQFVEGLKVTLGFYAVMFKNYCANKVKYGQQSYDFQEANLLCVAPRQCISFDEPVARQADAFGWGIFFHPDLIRGAALGKQMRAYSFFSYETKEALHLSDKEKDILLDCFKKIEEELDERIDKHSQAILISNIELLLNHCLRFYDRQFITRKNANKDVLSQVESILTQYFSSDQLDEKGLPTVKFLAEQLHLSPDYLSDLLKRETGMHAQDRIHFHLIEEAKLRLLGSDLTVSELAYSLGFEYPQYFSRLFKTKTGLTPLAFRNQGQA
ncbi:MAG: AraC family transcriptional regulator [Bacteroidetes bacterium]|nr:AraC family transcriptional regulator [Bacteroidota bacterium]